MKNATTDSRSFSIAMRRHVGHGRSVTVAQLAKQSGVSERNINAYRGEGMPPGWDNAMRIIAARPAEFGSTALKDGGILQVIKLGEADPCSFKLTAGSGYLVGELTKMLEDGHFDHIEILQIERLLLEFLPKAHAWLSARPSARVVAIDTRRKVVRV